MVWEGVGGGGDREKTLADPKEVEEGYNFSPFPHWYFKKSKEKSNETK